MIDAFRKPVANTWQPYEGSVWPAYASFKGKLLCCSYRHVMRGRYVTLSIVEFFWGVLAIGLVALLMYVGYASDSSANTPAAVATQMAQNAARTGGGGGDDVARPQVQTSGD